MLDGRVHLVNAFAMHFSVFTLLIFVALPLAAGSRAVACETVGTQACLVNEDSHPHEVRTGQSALFQIQTSRVGQRIRVRCTLTGPVSSMKIEFSNLTPHGWACKTSIATLGERVDAEIEGTTTDLSAVSFAFLNRHSSRLLWHECYNR